MLSGFQKGRPLQMKQRGRQKTSSRAHRCKTAARIAERSRKRRRSGVLTTVPAQRRPKRSRRWYRERKSQLKRIKTARGTRTSMRQILGKFQAPYRSVTRFACDSSNGQREQLVSNFYGVHGKNKAIDNNKNSQGTCFGRVLSVRSDSSKPHTAVVIKCTGQLSELVPVTPNHKTNWEPER